MVSEDPDYLVTRQDVDDLLDRIAELEAENEELREHLRRFDGFCVVHERKCWDLVDGQIVLRDCACPSCRRVLGERAEVMW